MTHAEAGLTRAEMNMKEDESTYAEVDTRMKGMKDCTNEKDMEMTLTQLANQEGWSNDKFIVKTQQMWELILDPRYLEMKKAHVPTYGNEEETSTAVRLVEAETSQGSPLSYTERDTG